MIRIAVTFFLLVGFAPSAWGQNAFLGVELNSDMLELRGAQIERVQSPSAASIMGLQAGDLVTGLDEVRISSAQELVEAVSRRLPGEIVTVHLIRGVEVLELMGILGRHSRLSENKLALPSQPLEFLDMSDSILADPLRLPSMEWRMPMISPLFGGELPGWPGSDWGEWADSFPRFDFQHDWGGSWPRRDLGGVDNSVQIRYPGSTPEADRERLLREAKEKYGPDVVVEFEGRGTSISIRRSMQGGSGGVPGEFVRPMPREEDEEI